VRSMTGSTTIGHLQRRLGLHGVAPGAARTTARPPLRAPSGANTRCAAGCCDLRRWRRFLRRGNEIGRQHLSWRGNRGHRRQQPISLARHGFDVARRIFGVPEHLAQLRHRLVDRRGADYDSAPYRFEQFVLTNHRARRLRQPDQQPHGARFDFHLLGATRQRVVARVD
jgi:hypothetical protein